MTRKVKGLVALLVLLIACEEDGSAPRISLIIGSIKTFYDSNSYYFSTSGSRRRYTVTLSPARSVYLYVGTTKYSNGTCFNSGKVVDVRPAALATDAKDTIVVKTKTDC